MESLEFVPDTTLLDNGIYEVSEAEGPTSGDPNIARLQEDLTTERERRLARVCASEAARVFNHRHTAR